MPAEQNSFCAICDCFMANYVSFMEKRAKHAAAMFVYTEKARRAQIHCVFLTVVLLQLLLCVNDIERNQGPDPNMEMLLQGLFTQQDVKFQTLFGQQLDMRLHTMENRLCAKMDSAFSAIENQVQVLQTKTLRLEEHCYGVLQVTRLGSSAVTSLKHKLAQVTTELEEKTDKLEDFSWSDNLKFLKIPRSVDEDYETCQESC